ncbi:MAG: hypothetical protein R6V75_01920 [Bacteroidales bacterium]
MLRWSVMLIFLLSCPQVLFAQPAGDTARVRLVLWPQVTVQNRTYRQLYEVQMNVAPELQLEIAKGLRFSGQVIIPVVNQISEEGNHVRPGILTLNQRFNIGNTFYGILSAGKFTNNRYGLDLRILNFFFDGRLTLVANVGLTGSNQYISKLVYSAINTLTWKLHGGFYMKHFNALVNVNYGRYLMGDHGVRLDAVRFFGRTAVGFWAMHSGGEFNGGFNFAIPLAPERYKRERRVRVGLPDHFFWEYRGRVWPKAGQSYEIQNEYLYFNNTEPLRQFNLVSFN